MVVVVLAATVAASLASQAVEVLPLSRRYRYFLELHMPLRSALVARQLQTATIQHFQQ